MGLTRVVTNPDSIQLMGITLAFVTANSNNEGDVK